MFKTALVVYLIGLCCYIIFSRQPDYFDGTFTVGVVTGSAENKNFEYAVDANQYSQSIDGWGASQVDIGQRVKVIYHPNEPKQASVYSFFSYWLHLHELVLTSVIFAILLYCAKYITGKEKTYYYTEEELRKKPKYDL